MGTHRRKWGWWLVLAIAVAVAASLLSRRCAPGPGGADGASSPASEADEAAVIRDTVYIQVDGETVPVITERKVEPAGGRKGRNSGRKAASTPESGEMPAEAPDEASASESAPASESASASAETVVLIPVSDLTGIIRQKSGRDITVSTKAPDHIDISYAGKVDIPLLGTQDMDFTAGFKVVDVQDDRLVLQLDSGTAMNLAAELASPLILERLPAGLVESFSNGRAVVNLKAIPQYSKRLSGVSITGITVDDGNIRFATVKK